MTRIRREQPADADAIREVVRWALAGHPGRGRTEPLIVDGLREDGALELSPVAGSDGAVVAHSAFSWSGIGDSTSGWFPLGPAAVPPNSNAEAWDGR